MRPEGKLGLKTRPLKASIYKSRSLQNHLKTFKLPEDMAERMHIQPRPIFRAEHWIATQQGGCNACLQYGCLVGFAPKHGQDAPILSSQAGTEP